MSEIQTEEAIKQRVSSREVNGGIILICRLVEQRAVVDCKGNIVSNPRVGKDTVRVDRKVWGCISLGRSSLKVCKSQAVFQTLFVHNAIIYRETLVQLD